mmetsp:Transcript_110149/g.355529  ORF Transcript_110149/g.355529 Transcript_110149/m.355529 type:complete len:353 (+) Transcript_110149:1658-2716(+)
MERHFTVCVGSTRIRVVAEEAQDALEVTTLGCHVQRRLPQGVALHGPRVAASLQQLLQSLDVAREGCGEEVGATVADPGEEPEAATGRVGQDQERQARRCTVALQGPGIVGLLRIVQVDRHCPQELQVAQNVEEPREPTRRHGHTGLVDVARHIDGIDREAKHKCLCRCAGDDAQRSESEQVIQQDHGVGPVGVQAANDGTGHEDQRSARDLAEPVEAVRGLEAQAPALLVLRRDKVGGMVVKVHDRLNHSHQGHGHGDAEYQNLHGAVVGADEAVREHDDAGDPGDEHGVAVEARPWHAEHVAPGSRRPWLSLRLDLIEEGGLPVLVLIAPVGAEERIETQASQDREDGCV